MISESGRIVSVESDCVWVETIQRSTCESCSAKKGCGQSMVAEWTGKTSLIRVLLNGRKADEFDLYDSVTIGIPERVVANGSLLVYMTPLLAMIAGLAVAESSAAGELGSMLLGLFGFGFGAFLVRLHSARHKDNADVQPVLLSDESPVHWVGEH